MAKARSDFTLKRDLDILTPKQNAIARIHKKLHFKDSYTINILDSGLDALVILNYPIIIARRVKSQRGTMVSPT